MSDYSKHGVSLPPEQQAIRDKCFHPAGTFVEFKKEEIEQSIPDRFEKIVRNHPHNVAVKTESSRWTYGELNESANHIARAILALRRERAEPIALLFEQGALAIAAILGVLKVDKFFVPLDPSHPPKRTRQMLEESQAALIVTDNKNFPLASELATNGVQLLNIDTVDVSRSTENLKISISPDARAYILYTSGSTGEPKGVIQNHRNVLHQIMNLSHILQICTTDRVTLLTSITGQAINTIFVVLLNGATIYPFNIREQSLGRLASWLTGEDLTVFNSVVAVFRNFACSLEEGEQFPKLRLIYLGGEPIYKTDVELYKKHFFPSCLFVNRLGTTEAGTLRYFFVSKDTQIEGDRVPVGYATEDMEILLFDDDGRDVGVNEPGEIVVRSRYLSLGYWKKPDLTEEKFKADPEDPEKRIFFTGDVGLRLPDGCLIHMGRKDFRVKIRGYSVEIAEVEMALRTCPGIAGTAVVARQHDLGEAEIIAYFTSVSKPGPGVNDVRGWLEDKLPAYMIPAAFVMLHAIPLTANGKIDRRALPDPGHARPGLAIPFVAPRTPLEQELAAIWARVLTLDRVGMNDSFFDLGGHSLSATLLVSQVLKRFQLEIPLRSLFDSPTVADMAAVITAHQGKKLGEKELDRILAEIELMSEEEAQRLLAKTKITATTKGERYE